VHLQVFDSRENFAKDWLKWRFDDVQVECLRGRKPMMRTIPEISGGRAGPAAGKYGGRL
jgi:hypothetical protein